MHDNNDEKTNIRHVQAHTKKVRLDIHLLLNHLVQHSQTYLSLYGTSSERAKALIGIIPPFVYLGDLQSYYLYF